MRYIKIYFQDGSAHNYRIRENLPLSILLLNDYNRSFFGKDINTIEEVFIPFRTYSTLFVGDFILNFKNKFLWKYREDYEDY